MTTQLLKLYRVRTNAEDLKYQQAVVYALNINDAITQVVAANGPGRRLDIYEATEVPFREGIVLADGRVDA